MTSSDDQNECPLCMELLEVDDSSFYPCTCGYQICRFCWHRLKTDSNGLCPACRKPYSDNPAHFEPLSEDEIIRIKKERRQKELQKKQKLTENRRHLADVRVVQKNLVFVVGLSQRLADSEVLKKNEYFGKFGKILKVVINPSPQYAGTQTPSASAYLTYSKPEEALKAIQTVNNIQIDNRILKASLGTTKYCSHFLKSVHCPKQDCMYLHDFGEEAASFTKEEMSQGKHLEYESKLIETILHIPRNLQNISPTSSLDQTTVALASSSTSSLSSSSNLNQTQNPSNTDSNTSQSQIQNSTNVDNTRNDYKAKYKPKPSSASIGISGSNTTQTNTAQRQPVKSNSKTASSHSYTNTSNSAVCNSNGLLNNNNDNTQQSLKLNNLSGSATSLQSTDTLSASNLMQNSKLKQSSSATSLSINACSNTVNDDDNDSDEVDLNDLNDLNSQESKHVLSSSSLTNLNTNINITPLVTPLMGIINSNRADSNNNQSDFNFIQQQQQSYGSNSNLNNDHLILNNTNQIDLNTINNDISITNNINELLVNNNNNINSQSQTNYLLNHQKSLFHEEDLGFDPWGESTRALQDLMQIESQTTNSNLMNNINSSSKLMNTLGSSNNNKNTNNNNHFNTNTNSNLSNHVNSNGIRNPTNLANFTNSNTNVNINKIQNINTTNNVLLSHFEFLQKQQLLLNSTNQNPNNLKLNSNINNSDLSSPYTNNQTTNGLPSLDSLLSFSSLANQQQQHQQHQQIQLQQQLNQAKSDYLLMNSTQNNTHGLLNGTNSLNGLLLKQQQQHTQTIIPPPGFNLKYPPAMSSSSSSSSSASNSSSTSSSVNNSASSTPSMNNSKAQQTNGMGNLHNTLKSIFPNANISFGNLNSNNNSNFTANNTSLLNGNLKQQNGSSLNQNSINGQTYWPDDPAIISLTDNTNLNMLNGNGSSASGIGSLSDFGNNFASSGQATNTTRSLSPGLLNNLANLSTNGNANKLMNSNNNHLYLNDATNFSNHFVNHSHLNNHLNLNQNLNTNTNFDNLAKLQQFQQLQQLQQFLMQQQQQFNSNSINLDSMQSSQSQQQQQQQHLQILKNLQNVNQNLLTNTTASLPSLSSLQQQFLMQQLASSYQTNGATPVQATATTAAAKGSSSD